METEWAREVACEGLGVCITSVHYGHALLHRQGGGATRHNRPQEAPRCLPVRVASHGKGVDDVVDTVQADGDGCWWECRGRWWSGAPVVAVDAVLLANGIRLFRTRPVERSMYNGGVHRRTALGQHTAHAPRYHTVWHDGTSGRRVRSCQGSNADAVYDDHANAAASMCTPKRRHGCPVYECASKSCCVDVHQVTPLPCASKGC